MYIYIIRNSIWKMLELPIVLQTTTVVVSQKKKKIDVVSDYLIRENVMLLVGSDENQ